MAHTRREPSGRTSRPERKVAQRVWPVVAVAAAGAIALAGCAPTNAEPTVSHSASPSPSETQQPSADIYHPPEDLLSFYTEPGADTIVRPFTERKDFCNWEAQKLRPTSKAYYEGSGDSIDLMPEPSIDNDSQDVLSVIYNWKLLAAARPDVDPNVPGSVDMQMKSLSCIFEDPSDPAFAELMLAITQPILVDGESSSIHYNDLSPQALGAKGLLGVNPLVSEGPSVESINSDGGATRTQELTSHDENNNSDYLQTYKFGGNSLPNTWYVPKK